METIIEKNNNNLLYSALIILQRISSVVIPAMIIIAPKTAIAGIIIIGLLALPFLLPNIYQIFKCYKSSALILIFIGFVVYLNINSFLAVDIGDAFSKVATIVPILLIVFLTPIYLNRLPQSLLKLFSIGLVIGVMIGTVWLLIEVPFGSPITSLIIRISPIIDYEILRLAIMNDGVIVGFHRFMLNKNIAILVMLLWPTILVLSLWQNKRFNSILISAFLLASICLIFLSENETSMIAVVLGLCAFIMSQLLPRFSLYLICIMWCISILFAVPIAKLPFLMGYQNAQWLPMSARDRFFIWKYTADRAFEKPILGVGIRGTPNLEEKTIDGVVQKKLRANNRDPLTLRLGNHAHNMYLQTWFELGAIGAVFLMIIGSQIIMQLNKLRSRIRPFGFALFTSSVTLISFGWGMWKTWLLASIAITIIFFMTVTQYEFMKSINESKQSS